MAQSDRAAQSAFKSGFLRRTAEARIGAGFSQEEIATLLKVPQDKYKHYEKRSLLPHYLVPAFCIATRVETSWLFGIPAKRPATATATSRKIA